MKLTMFFSTVLVSSAVALQAADKKIVLIAGGASHGSGDHEHKAGCLLFKKCLESVPGINVTVSTGWPQEANAFDGADAIVIYSDGGGGNPGIQGDRLKQIGAAVKKGAGFGCVHYAVEVPKEKGGKEWLEWIGGYFETHWSVNPFWEADFKSLPAHPVARGVKPFKQRDEWYFYMRFPENMKGVTPILSAVAPKETMNRPDGPHSGNPAVRASVAKGEPQHLLWVFERPDGSRGFGFTGGHSHKFWGNEDFRKAVLNAIVWIAKVEVPENGVQSVVTPEDLTANLDKKK
jgi:type 1 glutamine amidotransferase